MTTLWIQESYASAEFAEVFFLTARNEGNVVESVSFLSRDHYRDKARQGYGQGLPEGTNTVGSLGFAGFMTHIWAGGHVTATLSVMSVRPLIQKEK